MPKGPPKAATAPAANEAPAGASSCRVIVAAGSALLLLLTAAATLGGPHPEPPVSSAPHPEAPPVERVALQCAAIQANELVVFSESRDEPSLEISIGINVIRDRVIYSFHRF